MTDNKLQGLRNHNQNLKNQVMQYLQDSLILLLERKKFADITITELCNKAGVSRMAFYGNYTSKDDLFEQIVRSLNKDLVDAVGSPFNRFTGLSWYLNFFTVLSENMDTVKTVFGADRERYRYALTSVILRTKHLTELQKYQRIIWMGGIVDATLLWIDSGLNLAVDEIAEICYRALDSVLAEYVDS